MWQGPPYLDWKLDRWKIGVAVILLLLLLVRYIDREWVGARVAEETGDLSQILSGDFRTPIVSAAPADGTPTAEMIKALAPATAVSTVQPPTVVVAASTSAAAPATAASEAEVLLVVDEEAEGLVRSSHPTFTGVAAPHALLHLRVDDRRYEVQADEWGAWHFTLPEPLAVGMSWVQVVSADGGRPPVSRMLLLAPPSPLPPAAVALASTATPTAAVLAPSPQPTLTPSPTATPSVTGPPGDGVAPQAATAMDGPPEGPLPTLTATATAEATQTAVPPTHEATTTPTAALAVVVGPEVVPAALLHVVDEDGAGVVRSSRPTFTGTADPDTLLYLLVDDRRYEVETDERGTWRFTLPEPLSVGMSWVQVLPADSGTPSVSRMLLLAPASPSPAAVALVATAAATPLPSPVPATSTPAATAPVQPASTVMAAPAIAVGEERAAGIVLQVVDEDAAGFVHSSRPTLTGTADPATLLVLLVDDRRYEIETDERGAWRFTLPEPLSVGMSWVQVALADSGMPPVSRMLLLAPPAESPAVALATATTRAPIRVRDQGGGKVASGLAMAAESGPWTLPAGAGSQPVAFRMNIVQLLQHADAPPSPLTYNAETYTLAHVVNTVAQVLLDLVVSSQPVE